MFGLLVPNRPIQPSPHQTISQTEYAFSIPSQPAFSHLAVFLLPGNNLPSDLLAGIYIKLPGSASSAPLENNGFRLLGALANDKQSAVFRLAGIGGAHTAAGMSTNTDTGVREEIMLDDATGEAIQGAQGEDIVVGVSIEPAAQVQSQLATMRAQSTSAKNASDMQQGGQLMRVGQLPSADMLKEAAKKIGQNAYNFLGGFAQGPSGQEVVPLKSLQEWWTKFEKKVDMDVGFLMKDGG